MNDTDGYARDAAAYGGDGWRPRQDAHADEIGHLWRSCGVDSEWRTLESVLLHTPGAELDVPAEQADAALFVGSIDVGRARAEHEQMAAAYRDAGVDVITVDPDEPARPNQMFCADLFVMTPQGAILGRPAGEVRAGEEVPVARALSAAGVPILKTLTGEAVFEGADLLWLNETTAMIGRGHRTNQAAIDQIDTLFAELGYRLLAVDMPYGTMHLMGMLRIPASDLAICWHRRTPHATVTALRDAGFTVAFIPETSEARDLYRAMNFVTLQDRTVLMVAGIPAAQDFLESLGVECVTSPTDELSKAAGNIGCLTGVVGRRLADR